MGQRSWSDESTLAPQAASPQEGVSGLLKELARPPAGEGVELAPGAEVGRLVILREVGHGGMGRVYAARDPRLDRDVAVKVMSIAAREQALHRFAQEARLAGALRHPG